MKGIAGGLQGSIARLTPRMAAIFVKVTPLSLRESPLRLEPRGGDKSKITALPLPLLQEIDWLLSPAYRAGVSLQSCNVCSNKSHLPKETLWAFLWSK